MARHIDYASLFTLRSDGRYVASKQKNGKRVYFYDRDPKRLYDRLNQPQTDDVLLFENVAQSWLDEHIETVSPKTAETYHRPMEQLLSAFSGYEMTQITVPMIKAFLLSQKTAGYSRRSVQLRRDMLNMIFNYGLEHQYVVSNPISAVQMPKGLPSSKRLPPGDDVLTAVRNGLGLPFGLFAFLLLYTGLRRGEALALTYDDIDRKAGVIRVNKAITYPYNQPVLSAPKTEAGMRVVPLLDVLADVLPQTGKGIIFSAPDGGYLSKTMYRKRWRAYCSALGYDITAHQLRHSYASFLYEVGIGDKETQELLGHTSITTTRNVYTHIREQQRKQTAERLNKFFFKT